MTGRSWNYGSLRRRAAAALGVAVVTRAVSMVRACMPKLQEEALGLLFEEGGDCEQATGGSGGDGEACEREVAWALCQSGLLPWQTSLGGAQPQPTSCLRMID